jgi:hypothetical protein
MVEQGETMIPPELLKAIVGEVLAEYPVPLEEHDYIREMAYRLAGELTVDPAQVIACETLIVLDLAGWQVRCKVDFAELRGLVCHVEDYKTARGAPGFEEVSRKRKDGTLAAKNFQLILYALALAYGRPVRVMRGDSPEGIREEVLGPMPLAGHVEQFDLEFVYPGIVFDEKILRRPVSLTRLELGEYRESMVALLERLSRAEQEGDWPAVVSDDACRECPASILCPIPVELRDYRGKINTLEEASETAEVLDRRAAIDGALRKELKAFAKALGVSIPFGVDKEWCFEVKPVEEVKDKPGMWEAIEAAVEYGREFVRSDHVIRRTATNFVVRKRAPVEEGTVGDG